MPWALFFLAWLACFRPARAATADQWRGRSIYQIITDRFALPNGTDPSSCDPGKQTWCGGTWNTIRENLDYVQNAGFTAIWISPVNQNYEGPRTPYGDPYHGYWIADASQLNLRFGTSEDLKALSAELHRRHMYLMVDVVVNDVMATSTTPDFSPYMFKEASLYHPYCPIQWGNSTSEQVCWLGDTTVPLPDVDTTNPTVIARYGEWVQNLVKEYDIDGLRIDAAKHVQTDFWPVFCKSAGVFCIGEVFSGIDVESVAMYQGPQALDSVLNYPMYNALVAAFQIPGPLNTSAVVDTYTQSKAHYTDTTVLGNFLENQDLPRWHNMSVDPQSMYNAMVLNFLTDGIPIVYYGQEQYFGGGGDPWNREPLWSSKYQKTYAYNLIVTLNTLRNFLVNTTSWATDETNILTTSEYGIAVMKGFVISVVTNIGSPPRNNTQIAVPSPFAQFTALTDVLTCEQWVVGALGMLDVQYTKGGTPVILVPSNGLKGSSLCTTVLAENAAEGAKAPALSSSGASLRLSKSPLYLLVILSVLANVVFG